MDTRQASIQLDQVEARIYEASSRMRAAKLRSDIRAWRKARHDKNVWTIVRSALLRRFS